MFGVPTIPVVTKTLTAATPSVTLTYASPGGTPRHLVLRAEMQATSGNPNVRFRLNGDSGANYNDQMLNAYGTTANGAKDTSVTEFHLVGNIDDLSNAFSVSETLFPDALSTRTHKSALCQSGRLEEVVRLAAGRWESTAAITSIEIYVDSSTFAAGSTFELAVVDEAYVIDETINTGTANFDHSGISADDGDLVIIGNLRSDVSSHIEQVSLRLNNDTGGNYLRQRMTITNGTQLEAYANTSPVIAHGAGANADANSFSGLLVQIPNFSEGSNDRNALTFGGGHFSDSDQIVGFYNTRWNDTSAINRVAIYGLDATSGFVANSMLSIYKVPKGLITRTELGSDTSSVTFSSIPATYDHLEVTVYTRTDRSAVNDVVNMTFNTDTTASNYNHQEMQGAGSTVSANTDAANMRIGVYPSASEGSNEFGVGTTTIYNYTKTDRHKNRFTVMGTTERVLLYSRRWEDTSAINQIVLTPNVGTNFLAGSVFTLRGITATPTTSDAANVNNVVVGSIAAINSIAIASIQAVNNVALAGAGGGGSAYAGITWAADDTTPAVNSFGCKFGIQGAQGLLNANDKNATGYKDTYEHNGSSWSTTNACSGTHGVGGGGGTQSAGLVVNGWDDVGADESNVTEEYNGSTWSTGNNTVEGSAYLTGGGLLQTAQLITGGSKYGPTVRNLTMTQTYNGTSWSNESVASNGNGSGTSGESAGGGLDAFLSASGTLEAGENTNVQIFDQSAGTWTSKASCSTERRYTASSTDGTRVFKMAGTEAPSWNAEGDVESWVEDTWTTENSLPVGRQGPGYGTGGLESASGDASIIGGVDGSNNRTDNYYISTGA